MATELIEPPEERRLSGTPLLPPVDRLTCGRECDTMISFGKSRRASRQGSCTSKNYGVPKAVDQGHEQPKNTMATSCMALAWLLLLWLV